MGARSGQERPFTPGRETAADLSARTVGRDRLLKLLHAKLLSCATSTARPHVLLVGPRGAGKSHVIEVALHRAESESSFAEKVVVVRVPEDAVSITRYSDLLAEVLHALSGDRAGPLKMPAPDLREARIAEVIGERVILLVVENLDRVFEDIGLAGQRSLRAWVETTGQVMLLATTPLLFPGVKDRDKPWFGGIATFLLADLTADEGQQLLVHIAGLHGDRDLLEFVQSPTGVARLRAVADLTGGSPRTWMILADLATNESLDELIPAVEDLLEGLVPYYQQLLWGLSANERRLVSALASTTGAATVSQLADVAEIEQRTAAATLGRLADARWVLAEKPVTGDRRTTFYRLREPMLRHHMQYRSGFDDPLELIVSLLRSFYDPQQRTVRYLEATPGSLTERTLSASVEGLISAGGLWSMSTQALQLQARTWCDHDDSAFRTAGGLLDLVLRYASGALEESALKSHLVDGPFPKFREPALREALADITTDGPGAKSIPGLLSLLALALSGDRAGLLLRTAAVCWEGPLSPASTALDLESLQAESTIDPSDPVSLTTSLNLAIAYRSVGSLDKAIELFEATLADMERVLGPDHPNTLTSRGHLALARQAVGDLDGALALVEADPETGANSRTDRERMRLPFQGAVVMRALQSARSGKPTPSLRTNTPMRKLVANLLAAAQGDEAARLSLPGEWLRLLEDESNLDSDGQ